MPYIPYLPYIPNIPYIPNMPYQTDHTHHTYPTPQGGGEGGQYHTRTHHRGGRGTVLWLTHDHGGGGGGWNAGPYILYVVLVQEIWYKHQVSGILMNIGYTVTWIQADIDLAVQTMVQNGYSFHPGSSTNNGLTFRWWTSVEVSIFKKITKVKWWFFGNGKFCPTPKPDDGARSSNVIYGWEAIAGR